MTPNAEWGFTAHPDFPRICRELASVGCAVGLVTMKGEKPVTLVDTQAKGVQVPAGVASAAVAGTLGRWRVVAGEQTKAALGVRPVRVEGFKASALEATPQATLDKTAEQNARFASLRMFIASRADATWTQADGTKIRVQAMSDSHLHFALAKAYRKRENRPAGTTGIEALKAEAARRLLRFWGLAPESTASVHSGAHVAMDLETQTVKPAQVAPPSTIGRVVSYDPRSATVQLFGTGGQAGGTSGLFDFKTGPMPRGPFLVEEATRRVEAATRSLIGAQVILTPEGRAQAQRKIQTTIQDAMGPHYSVGVELVGGPFGITANVSVDERLPPYMR